MLSALRDFGETWQTFWGCDENNVGGVLGVRIDGATDFTGSTLAAADDYTGTVTATWLSSGTHTWQMLLNGAPVGSVYNFTTAPASGESVTLLFMGDTNTEVDAAMSSIAARETPNAIFASELHYLDGSSYGGALYTDANDIGATASFPTSYDRTLNGFGASKGFRQKYRTAYSSEVNRLTVMRKWPIFHTPGNHDIGQYDGASNTVTMPGTVRYDAGYKAIREYPNAGMPQATGDIDTEPAIPYYFSKVIGDVEIICVDQLSYAQPASGRNMNQANGTFPTGAGDDKQLAWVKSRIQNSTANVIVLFTTATIPQSSHAGIVEWNHATTGLWKFVDGINKTILQIACDAHIHYAFLRATNMSNRKLMEFGCSPSSGVTSCNPVVSLAGVDTEHFTDCEKATLTGDALSTDTTLNVSDTGGFVAGKKVTDQYGARATTINSIDVGAKTLTLATGMGGATQVSGLEIRSAKWPATADAGTEHANLAGYIRLTRRPNGNHAVSSAHTQIEFVATTSGRVRWSCYIKDGERLPFFPRVSGAPSAMGT